jgi:hypothetical protein
MLWGTGWAGESGGRKENEEGGKDVGTKHIVIYERRLLQREGCIPTHKTTRIEVAFIQSLLHFLSDRRKSQTLPYVQA